MRIDKFIWLVRLYKTRTIASKACIAGKVKLNDKIAKPSKIVVINDEFSLKKGPVSYRFEVTDLPKNRVGAKLVDDYIKNITPKEEQEKINLLKLRYSNYRAKGLGRPTKKERREIDDFSTEEFNSEWNIEDWNDWDENES